MDVIKWIDDHAAVFIDVSNRVWEAAEIAYREARSAVVLEEALEKAGFTVERGVAGIPTAFIGSFGTGRPVVAILGEYDALPGLSQDKVPYRKILVDGGAGHGCGHNLLGAGSLAAAVAVARAIEAGDVKGTIRYYGCPAEEGGSGKGHMVNAGLFNDVDLALTWHPDSLNAASSVNVLAATQAFFRFHGKTAHAAADPYNGRSALDAVELMNIGVNYLREHMLPDARIHYIITKGGGAVNVVPDLAESRYLVRSPQTYQVTELFERVKAVAQGAALMTGTEFEIIFDAGYSNMILNDTIIGVLHEKLVQIGVPAYSEDELHFAEEIAKTVDKTNLLEGTSVLGPEPYKMLAQMKDKLFFDDVLPVVKTEIAMPGSTDVGDVSWIVPTGQISTTCSIQGTPGHSWQQVAQGSMGIGHKGLLYAGKALAAGAIEFMRNPELLQKARDEFAERTRDHPYVSPIPAGVRPPI